MKRMILIAFMLLVHGTACASPEGDAIAILSEAHDRMAQRDDEWCELWSRFDMLGTRLDTLAQTADPQWWFLVSETSSVLTQYEFGHIHQEVMGGLGKASTENVAMFDALDLMESEFDDGDWVGVEYAYRIGAASFLSAENRFNQQHAGTVAFGDEAAAQMDEYEDQLGGEVDDPIDDPMDDQNGLEGK